MKIDEDDVEDNEEHEGRRGIKEKKFGGSH